MRFYCTHTHAWYNNVIPCRSELSGRDACHFVNGSRRAPVALASFPGSGNTWMRGLLEKATGVCTGELLRIMQCMNARTSSKKFMIGTQSE